MQKTALASAIAVTLGCASAHAATITITQMDFGGLYVASGSMNDSGNGLMQSVDPFFYQPWTATQKNWFDTHSSTLTWSGDGSAGSFAAFSYTFHLTGNQVAAGTFFDWSGNNGIPVLTIYSCDTGGSPNACTGASLPMATAPFPGQQPGFNGTTTTDFPVSGSPVPVPAAVWLFGSGLVGLVGVARRRKQRV
jgi:hypothetical protein